MESLLTFFDWFIKSYERLVKTYPRAIKTLELSFLCLVAACAAYGVFALYVLNAPRMAIHSYFAALNKKRWADACQFLAPELAIHMNASQIEKDYAGFEGHENLSTALAPNQNAIDVFLNDRIQYYLTYEFHVTLDKNDLASPNRHSDVLWAEIADPAKLHDLQSNPGAAPIHLRTQQVKLCTLQRYDGQWRILDYWERVTDSLKFR